MDPSVEKSLDAIAYHTANISSSLEYIGNAGLEQRLDETNRALRAINQTLKQLVSVTESSLKAHSDT